MLTPEQIAALPTAYALSFIKRHRQSPLGEWAGTSLEAHLFAALADALLAKAEAERERDALAVSNAKFSAEVLKAIGDVKAASENLVAERDALLRFAGDILEDEPHDPMDIGEKHGLVKTIHAGTEDQQWAFTPLGEAAVRAAKEATDGAE